MEIFWEYARAFLCGGVLCLIGQVLIDKTKLTPARILVLYVVSGVVLGGLGIYKYIAQFGGAGATVPLPGFGNLLARGVREAVAEHGLLGALTGGLSAATAGITAASFYQAFGKKYTGPEIHIEDEECGKPEDVQQRLETLRALYEQKLITQEEYGRKRQEILKEL